MEHNLFSSKLLKKTRHYTKCQRQSRSASSILFRWGQSPARTCHRGKRLVRFVNTKAENGMAKESSLSVLRMTFTSDFAWTEVSQQTPVTGTLNGFRFRHSICSMLVIYYFYYVSHLFFQNIF